MADKQTVEAEIKKLIRGLKIEHYDLLHKHGYADFKLDKETKESEGYAEDEKWLEGVYVEAFKQLLIKERIAATKKFSGLWGIGGDGNEHVATYRQVYSREIANLENQLGEKSSKRNGEII